MLRVGALAMLLLATGCSRPASVEPPAERGPRKPHPDPSTCEALARFHDATPPNAWSLATVRTKYRDCTSGTCMTWMSIDAFHPLRGPEIGSVEGGLPHASAERLTQRPDDYVLLAAHVGPDGVTPSWAYPLYFAAEGEAMLATLDQGQCPPVRLPRDASCAQCEPGDCATGCCRGDTDCEPECCG